MAQGLLILREMDQLETLRKPAGLDGFDYPTLEEVISLWRSYRSGGLGPEEAWHAIVAGVALDMVFSRGMRARRIVQ